MITPEACNQLTQTYRLQIQLLITGAKHHNPQLLPGPKPRNMVSPGMIRKVLHIYDLKQDGTLDLFYIPDVFYALGENPTM